MQTDRKNKYGLLGKDIAYSFSENYFAEKFKQLNLEGYTYDNFDLQDLSSFKEILSETKNLNGMNVTIPYKESVIPFLTTLDPTAAAIGAVNTIKFTEEGTIGYNTDVIGFKNAIETLIMPHHKKALILGTGGASKAVAHVFKDLEIPFLYVSRRSKEGQISYKELTKEMLQEHQIIVNCTPIGTFPEVDQKPNIDYDQLGAAHIAFDLIYNPEVTAFLNEAKKRGAKIKNGYEMLVGQAEASWEIWHS
ncbi:MAG: shikimate dehydrogenase [Bacteroidetes bacterium]|nr:shikimate dehydrogenase [Bacteroidota bacterium]